MMEEFLKLLGPALVGCLAALTAYLKTRSERKDTKSERDKDSLEMHDKLLKHDFDINRLKDDISLDKVCIDDLKEEFNTLNTHLVRLETNIQNLTDMFSRFVDAYESKKGSK